MLQVVAGILVVSLLMVHAYPALAVEPLEKVSIETPRLENAAENQLGTKISINQQVQIVADIKNNQDEKQEFIYIVQIKDSTQKIVSLGWLSGQLNEFQANTASLSWDPKTSDEYIVEIYVWESITVAIPLAPVEKLVITVS